MAMNLLWQEFFLTAQERELLEALSPVLQGMGLHIVDLSSAIAKGTQHLVLVVFHPEGIGHKDLEYVHKTVQARLEVLYPYGRDMHIEVSTPGIDRNIKNDHEFDLFIGKGVRVLTRDADDWLYGVIKATTAESIELESNQEKYTIQREQIRKAKLDPEQDRR